MSRSLTFHVSYSLALVSLHLNEESLLSDFMDWLLCRNTFTYGWAHGQWPDGICGGAGSGITAPTLSHAPATVALAWGGTAAWTLGSSICWGQCRHWPGLQGSSALEAAGVCSGGEGYGSLLPPLFPHRESCGKGDASWPCAVLVWGMRRCKLNALYPFFCGCPWFLCPIGLLQFLNCTPELLQSYFCWWLSHCFCWGTY